MKRMRMTVAALAGILAAASVTAATIAKGPGGRLYFAQRVNDAGIMKVQLQSVAISNDWGYGTIQTHGLVTDNYDNSGWPQHSEIGIHPTIETSGGLGYGTLVMGLFYNNTPASTRGAQVLDVLRLTPSEGALSTTLLGDGRDHQANWKDTDDGLFARPDSEGLFTGGSGRIVTGLRSAATGRLGISINYNEGGTADITDNDADYHATTFTGSGGQMIENHILGNRMYVSDTYYMAGPTYGGVYYFERQSGGSYTQSPYWRSTVGTNGWDGLLYRGTMRFAVGRVTVNYGGPVQRDAIYWNSGFDGSYRSGIAMAVDVNGNGVADDPGEYSLMYWTNIVSTARFAHNVGDLAFVTDAKTGNSFLLVADNGGTMTVLELNADGTWAGKTLPRGGVADDYKKVFYPGNAGPNGWWFTFDAYVPPPPKGSVVLLR